VALQIVSKFVQERAFLSARISRLVIHVVAITKIAPNKGACETPGFSLLYENLSSAASKTIGQYVELSVW
jgi:hypothetical protein